MNEQSAENFDKGRTLAGIFAYTRIVNFVNDIRAASYPQTPASTGGAVYQHLNYALDAIEALMGGQDRQNLDVQTQYAIAEEAIEGIESLIRTHSTASQPGSATDVYLRHFQEVHTIMQALIAGKSPREILDNLKLQSHQQYGAGLLPPGHA